MSTPEDEAKRRAAASKPEAAPELKNKEVKESLLKQEVSEKDDQITAFMKILLNAMLEWPSLPELLYEELTKSRQQPKKSEEAKPAKEEAPKEEAPKEAEAKQEAPEVVAPEEANAGPALTPMSDSKAAEADVPNVPSSQPAEGGESAAPGKTKEADAEPPPEPPPMPPVG